MSILTRGSAVLAGAATLSSAFIASYGFVAHRHDSVVRAYPYLCVQQDLPSGPSLPRVCVPKPVQHDDRPVTRVTPQE